MAERKYLKPKLPAKFMIISSSGWDDGPFYAADLVPSTLDGEPWVIARDGSPKVFRVLEQHGYELITEEGPLWLEPLEDSPAAQ